MSLSFDEPVWFWLLAGAVPVSLVAWRFLVSMGRLRRASAVIARVLLFGTIAALLAGASDVSTSDKLAVVAIVDVSGSARRFADAGESEAGRVDALEGAQRMLETIAAARGPDDLLGVVAFDGSAVAVATPTTSDPTARSLDVRVREGTDIAAAIELAAGLVPQDAAGRLLLISDGNETRGDALSAARRLASRGGEGESVRVDVAPLAYRVGSETIVESVDAPPKAPPGSLVTVRVVLSTTAGTSGTVRLYRQGEPIDARGDTPGLGRRVSLPPGRHPVLMDIVLPDARLHRFEAVFTPDALAGDARVGGSTFVGDAFLDNNRGESFTVSPGAGSVLLIDGVSGGDPDGPGSTLARALEGGGNTVRVVAPSGVPQDLIGLQPYDLVILQSAASDEIAEPAQRALAAHVSDLGAGLIMVGGPGSFGAGAWKGTPIEPILPVRLDLPEKLIVPETAIVLVIDSSGSMGSRVGGSTRTQQEIANQAAIAAVNAMDKRDLIGVVEFESSARWAVELAPNEDPDESARSISEITAGGGTNLPPGLELAYEALLASDAKVRHIVVLSDGVSSGADTLPELAAQIASDGIHISTIAVGDGADLVTLSAVAESGGGSFYRVTDPNVLPRVFVRAVRVVRSPMIRESPFDPVLLDPASPAVSGIAGFPELGGVVLTQFRDDPRVTDALATPGGEPLLSHWTVELGRVAAFTSDAWRWASGWLPWEGYQQMWNQLARSMARSGGSGLSGFRAEQTGRGLRLVYTAVDDRGAPVDLLRVPVTLYDPANEPAEVLLEQVGPGEYALSVDAPQTGTYIAVATPRLGARRLPPAITGASIASGVEYERLSSNVALLEQIASVTGGRVLSVGSPDPEALWSREGLEPRVAQTPIWERLLVIGLIVLLLDVGTRRVAWDRIIGERAVKLDAAERAVESLAKLQAKRRKRAGTTPTFDATPVGLEERPTRPRRGVARAEPAPAPEVIDRTQTEEDDKPAGLLAAKRRASKRFEEE